MIEKGATQFNDAIKMAKIHNHQHIVDYIQNYMKENGIT